MNKEIPQVISPNFLWQAEIMNPSKTEICYSSEEKFTQLIQEEIRFFKISFIPFFKTKEAVILECSSITKGKMWWSRASHGMPVREQRKQNA